MIDFTRQNDNFYLKKMKKTYRIIRLFTHKRKFVPEMVLLWHKMVINVLVLEGLCAGGEKGGLYVEEHKCFGKGGLISRGPIRWAYNGEIGYLKRLDASPKV